MSPAETALKAPGAGSRRKGASGEREFAAALHDLIGIRLARRLTQVRGGGHDLEVPEGATGPVAEALGRLAVEVKRYATTPNGSLAQWWGQACRQAEAVGLWPALCYRGDRQPWRVRLPLAALRPDLYPVWSDPDLTADLPLPAFASLVREGAICPCRAERGQCLNTVSVIEGNRPGSGGIGDGTIQTRRVRQPERPSAPVPRAG